MLAEEDARRILDQRGLELGPLRASISKVPKDFSREIRPNFLLDLEWGGQTQRFAAEYKRSSTPKMIEAAISQARNATEGKSELLPMIIAPYLGDDSLQRLLQEKVSGIDLSGNAVVIVPGQWLIILSGKPNRYPSSAPIKAIYSGTSSLVGRVLFSRPTFDQLKEIQKEIVARGGKISLGTISKVLKGLEDDLIVSREPQIELVRPERLLERLKDRYEAPEVRQEKEGKLALTREVFATLRKNARAAGARLIGRAESQYAVSASTATATFYTTSIDAVLQNLPFKEGARFANAKFIETEDPRIYFDAREVDGFQWASPLQIYLELARGGKREQETAEQLKQDLIHFRYSDRPNGRPS